MPSASSAKTRTAIAFACVYFFWGSTYLAIHVAGLHLAPPLVGALRTLVSAAILGAFCLARGISLRMPRRTAWQLILIGILFMSANAILLIWAETMVPSGYASLVIAMIPILVAVIETALPGGETLNLRGWLGTLLGAIGMLALLWPSLHRAAGSGSDSGPDSRSVAGFVNLAIAIAAGNFQTAQWTTAGILSVLYLATFGSVVGLTAYVYLLKHVPVTKVSTYAFVNPVIAVLIGVVTLHERLAPAEVLGMIIILISVATVILSRTKRAPIPADATQEVPVEE